MRYQKQITDHLPLALICIIIVCGLGLTGTAKGEWLIFEISSIEDVENGPSSDSIFTLSRTTTISHIRTYHWNYGQGALPGNIRLRDQNGNWYGPWPASGESEMGVDNAYWNSYPGISLSPGSYTIMDSDKRTWSCNSNTGWRGFAWVWAK